MLPCTWSIYHLTIGKEYSEVYEKGIFANSRHYSMKGMSKACDWYQAIATKKAYIFESNQGPKVYDYQWTAQCYSFPGITKKRVVDMGERRTYNIRMLALFGW